tara:strand:+ start:204 stop:443 length:240 start_codon:yes stop_codon:yes gene_type:complete
MSPDNIKKVLKKIVIKITKKKVNLTNFNFSKNFDSIEILDFISQIEKKFKIKFKDKSINHKNFSNITALIKLISNEKKK